MAFGSRFPKEFNPDRVPVGFDLMQAGQHAADPHDRMGRQFLPSFFIVGGHLNTIPPTRALMSRQLNLKRCGMCQVTKPVSPLLGIN